MGGSLGYRLCHVFAWPVSEAAPDQRDAYPCKQNPQEEDADVEVRLNSYCHEANGEADYDEDDTHYH